MKSRHNSSLIRGLDEEELKHFVASYKAGKIARERLTELFNRKIQDSVLGDENPKKLLSNNYTLQLADQFGYRRAYREVIYLLNQELDNG